MLPYPLTATVIQRPNTALGTVKCSLWPARPRPDAAGVHYDHEAEAPVGDYALLSTPNRVLRIDGADYVIVEAVLHGYFPHVAMRLRRSKGAGV